MSSTYEPGVCNIGPAEIKARRTLGWVGLVATVAALVAFVALDAPDPVRVLVAIPAAIAANGFLQAALHFCVGFAMKGLYNLDRSVGQTESVMQQEFRAADRKKGLQIVGLSVLIAAATVAIAVLLP